MQILETNPPLFDLDINPKDIWFPSEQYEDFCDLLHKLSPIASDLLNVSYSCWSDPASMSALLRASVEIVYAKELQQIRQEKMDKKNATE